MIYRNLILQFRHVSLVCQEISGEGSERPSSCTVRSSTWSDSAYDWQDGHSVSEILFSPSEKTLDAVIEAMGGKGDQAWRKFFDIMMSSYKMEMRPPREYKKREMICFKAPLLIIASESDIFFPASRVFGKARELFVGPVTTVEIDSKHLPSDKTMVDVCKQAKEFFKNT